MKLFAGVDPGQLGGLAVLNESGETFWTPYSFKDQTPNDIAETFLKLTQLDSYFDVFCTLEAVHSMTKHGVASSFKFGINTGILWGIVAAYKIKSSFVSPQKWQKAMSCLTHGDKNISKAMAQRLWPKIKITHQIADALLIAEYSRRTFGA